MLNRHRLLLGLVLLVLIGGINISARAQGDDGTLILDDPQTSYPVGLHSEFLEDPDGTLTIEDVTQPEFAARFTPNQEEIPNFGFTSSAYWIRIHVRNETSQESDWRLAFSDARLGMIDFYYQQADETGWTHQQAGRWLPATTREYLHPHIIFPLVLSPSNEGTIYLRLQASLSIRFALTLWPAGVFEQANHAFLLLLGLFYGIMIIMAVYNFVIFLVLRKLSYLYYFLFISALIINLSAIDGVFYAYLFPNGTQRYTHLVTISLSLILAK